ncbi:DUF1917 domain-containing protein [Methanofollis formosanus]|uniref:DUF1917 domain-containing protein n=1 Tax=Methanofollis formosanus TaxID=299308 RepID=A0A8G1A2A7_9EURY|nr:putative phosphothreonine lyase domain-containg protein [Methanofollis formosanus]QYZ79255.1 DUF1917 domain-containing protein [Methanofollis formosanus]
MDEVDSDTLADAAYGIFEIMLSKGLEARGAPLFSRVEAGIDFFDDFNAVFADFARDYPPLADALLARFGSVEAVYRTVVAGEGVVPTMTTQMYWITADNPAARGLSPTDEQAGKWLIFCDTAEVDALWKNVRDATVAGDLGISAKVSTARPNPDSRDDRKVVYVYTRDWSDEADVMRVREHLRALGVVDRIGYKRNLETFAGEYSEKGKKVTYYSA